MKQVLLNRGTGEVKVEEVPAPTAKSGGLLVQNVCSLISVGTERSSVTLGKKGLLAKARSRPNDVRLVISTARREGVGSAYQKVRSELAKSQALGYSCAGTVLEVGANCADFQPGTQVACAGAGYASHAEIIWVPKNLCVPVPDGVSEEEAAFATVGSIALQGFRQADLSLGQVGVVLGLGLVGQITVQILRAAGCRVIGADPDPGMVNLARDQGMEYGAVLGVDDIEAIASDVTKGRGVDAVLITASTESSEPAALAGKLCMDRGSVIVVGDVGMDLPRKDYYDKELSLRLSRSYGPGRYDSVYEEQGIDYPVGYVRWTEKRNMEQFLEMLRTGSVKVDRLITHRYDIGDAPAAYELITSESSSELRVGIILQYGSSAGPPLRRVQIAPARQASRNVVKVGVIGAGNFARGTLLPLLQRMKDVELVGVAAASGNSAGDTAKQFGFSYACTDYRELLNDDDVSAVVVVTRDNLHASLTCECMKAGKAVYVEKPLALAETELIDVVTTARESGQPVMVGFNRRFAPTVVKVKEFFDGLRGPLIVNCRVNAGVLSSSHWIQGLAEGGGRIKGEVCHFVDLSAWLVGSRVARIGALATGAQAPGLAVADNLVIHMAFENGSVGTITYTSQGDPQAGKERFEVFGNGSTAVIDDFKHVSLSRDGRQQSRRSLLSRDKGHAAELRSFINMVRNGIQPDGEFQLSVDSTLATLCIEKSLQSGQAERVPLVDEV